MSICPASCSKELAVPSSAARWRYTHDKSRMPLRPWHWSKGMQRCYSPLPVLAASEKWIADIDDLRYLDWLAASRQSTLAIATPREHRRLMPIGTVRC